MKAHIFTSHTFPLVIDDISESKICSSLSYPYLLQMGVDSLTLHTLFPEKTIRLTHSNTQSVFIFPLIGGVEVKVSDTNLFVHQGQIWSEYLNLENTITVENPYAEEKVQFIEMKIKEKILTSGLLALDITKRNELNLLMQTHNLNVYWGIFEGRQKGAFNLSNTTKNTWIWCIYGALEVNDRLLETYDALYLSEIENIEFESLTNFSVFIVFTNTQIT